MNLGELKSKAERALELDKTISSAPWSPDIIEAGAAWASDRDDVEEIKNQSIFIAASRTLLPDLAEGVMELMEELKSERSGARSTKYMAEAESLERKLAIAEEALEFYAEYPKNMMRLSDEAWFKPMNTLKKEDYLEMSDEEKYRYADGKSPKIAIEALKKIRGEINDVSEDGC